MPSAKAWKRSAKFWRKKARHERDKYWRQNEALRNLGVTVVLASKVFDNNRGDRVMIWTKSNENSNEH